MRAILGILGGAFAFVLVVSLLNRGLRLWFPGYEAVEKAMDFTTAMMAARLVIGAVSALAAGAALRLIAPSSRFAPYWLAAIALALFVPVHLQIWTKFPIWYHAAFLAPLAPLILLGAGRAR
ncbi:MAG: hypothetical protein K2Q06_12715 [Parvularculaceae bacterium]|nr:hypothetical protein [Parvularculaceae bacterium]